MCRGFVPFMLCLRTNKFAFGLSCFNQAAVWEINFHDIIHFKQQSSLNTLLSFNNWDALVDMMKLSSNLINDFPHWAWKDEAKESQIMLWNWSFCRFDEESFWIKMTLAFIDINYKAKSQLLAVPSKRNCNAIHAVTFTEKIENDLSCRPSCLTTHANNPLLYRSFVYLRTISN